MDDFEFEAPNLESTVEDNCIAWAEQNGWFARMMKYRGRNGCRDCDFYGHGKIVMVEFKRTGGSMRGNQIAERERMRKAGLKVHVIDNLHQFIRMMLAQAA